MLLFSRRHDIITQVTIHIHIPYVILLFLNEQDIVPVQRKR